MPNLRVFDDDDDDDGGSGSGSGSGGGGGGGEGDDGGGGGGSSVMNKLLIHYGIYNISSYYTNNWSIICPKKHM